METENKKILLVEDDPNFGSILKDYLILNEFDVTLAKNGMEGFEKFKKDSFALCILDVMMPYKDGYTLAKEIREKNKDIPIIFLTAKSMKEDVLKGYKVGADDYLNKPFDSEVLLMKIKAILQRKANDVKADATRFEFEIGNFHLNSKLRFLTLKNEEPVKLSPKENELLKMLAVYENDLMPRELALTKIWRDDNYFTSRSMDVYIAKLRKYLKPDDNVEILNIHGEGFRLVVKNKPIAQAASQAE
ncbi:response regulator transcription factor [Flavobacterium sp.]|uniref:response regulator transcription factor n=1 Tax=Flavobacterium sp. TaxID=239 RepID=UPI002632805C|nr:response regulator transcription factor [Flavobacterium sp.]